MLEDVDIANHVQCVLYLLLIPLTDTIAKRWIAYRTQTQNYPNPAQPVIYRELESYRLDFLLVAFSWRVTFAFLSSILLRITGNDKYLAGAETFWVLIGFDFGQILLGSFVRGMIARNFHQLHDD